MDTQEQLFGLMAVAEEHQKAVQVALDGLAAERAALSQAAANVVGVTAEVKRAAAEAVELSVTQSLAQVSAEAAEALGEAAKPVLGRLSGVVLAASEAEGAMKRAGQWFAWKWVAVAAGGLMGVCLVAYASLTWQLHQVESLREQKAALAADVAQLQASVATLEKRGGRIRLNRCGPEGRLCVEIAPHQGKGMTDFRGSWEDRQHNRRFVIPKGY